MHATMTDVQKAIEQLGRHDADGSRSFSFASSRGDGDGDWTDRDSATDTDGEVDGWHLNARQRLAEKSRMVNEGSAGPSTLMRVSAPPIEVELSDESEAEAEGDEHASQVYDEQPYLRQDPYTPKEREGDSQTLMKAKPSSLSFDLDPGTPVVASDAYIVPSPGVIMGDLPTASPHRKSFVKEQDQGPRVASPELILRPAPEPEPEVKLESQPEQVPPAQIPLPTSPSLVNGVLPSPPPSTPSPAVSPMPVSSVALADPPPERASTPIFQPPGTPSSSIFAPIGIQQALGTPTKPQSPFRPQGSQTPPPQKSIPSPLSSSKPPAEWTVEEVVDWLKDKGIDQGTCGKFIGMTILLKLQVCGVDILIRRARYYWRRPSGVGPRVAQDRDWHHCFWQTEAHCQRY